MKKIVTTTMLLMIGLLTTSYIAPALAIPHGPFWDLGSVNNLGWNVYNIWTLTYGEDHKVYGGTSDGFAGSHFFVVDLQSNGGYYPLTLATAVTDLGNYDVEIFALTPGRCTCLNWTYGDTECGYPLAIYGGSYKASDGNGGHFFVFYTDPTTLPNFFDYGALWLAPGNVPPAPGGPIDEAIINDLTTGKCGMVYGGTGYGSPVGFYDWAYLFGFNPETETFTQIFHCENATDINNVEAGIHGEIYFTCRHPGGGSFWVYDPSRTIPTVTFIAWASAVVPGATCFWLNAMTVDKDGIVYLGTDNGHLVRYDPGTGPCGTGTITDLGQVIAGRTEGIRGMTACAWGLIYMGTSAGYFVVYDPRTAWNPASAGSWNGNPGNIGPVGGEIRIRTLVTCSKHSTVFGGTAPDAHLFYYYKCTKDYNNDGVIDMKDIAPVAAEYGWHYTPPTTYCALGVGAAVAAVVLTVRNLKKSREKKQQT